MAATVVSVACKMVTLPWRASGQQPDGVWTVLTTGIGVAGGLGMLLKGAMTGREIQERIITMESLNGWTDTTALLTGDMMLAWYSRIQSDQTITAIGSTPITGDGATSLTAPRGDRPPKAMLSVGLPQPALDKATFYDMVTCTFYTQVLDKNYRMTAWGWWWDRARIIAQDQGFSPPGWL